MKIKVTARDIRLGSQETGRRTVTHCAVARAFRRQFPKSDIRVGYYSISIDERDGSLPYFVKANIYKIVAGEHVTPFDFEMPKLGPRYR